MIARIAPLSFSVSVLCLATLSALAADKPDLRLVGEWQSTDKDAVVALLHSVAREFQPHVTDAKLPTIEVEQKGGPITLFKRGPNGEIRVKLATEGYLWSQHSYQFAHELGHILCRYDEDKHPNKWFEETLCELASLYAMRRMSETWKTTPPYPHWKDYGPSLKKYADERMSNAQLPAGVKLTEWYAERAEAFNKNATNRENNAIVAGVLLPLFEKNPENWATVAMLNAEKLTPAHGFREYLIAWKKNCVEKQKPFVDQIAAEFGMRLE